MAREGVIRQVQPYELHGVRYYQMFISYPETPNQAQQVRLPHDAVYEDPAEGDVVIVQQLLSMVTEVRKKDA